MLDIATELVQTGRDRSATRVFGHEVIVMPITIHLP